MRDRAGVRQKLGNVLVAGQRHGGNLQWTDVSSASSNFAASRRRRRLRARPSGRRIARVGRFADRQRQRQPAEERHAHLRRRGFGAAAAERVRGLAAMRADVGRHVLDQAEHRHAHLVEQVDRAPRVDQRQVLRGRHDHRAGRPRVLDQRQLHVAGAGRQVDDQKLGVAPVGLDQLGERARRHRPAPGERVAGRDQLAQRQEADAMGLDRDQLVVVGGRPARALPSSVGCEGP